MRSDDELVLIPQADGGEGTLAAIADATPGAVTRSAGTVTGPDGRPTPGEWLALPDGTAVVELAQASGLPLMSRPDPLRATTRGLGEVIAAALDAGATALVIALGGSASTDGGAGALSALGLRLLDSSGLPVPDGGAHLAAAERLDRNGLVAAPAGGVVLLSDVTAPLLGPRGAAAAFAPQKGANPGDIELLESGLRQFASLWPRPEPASLPGAGAAGGTAFGFAVAWDARIESGSATIAALTGFDAALAAADVVITGEGRFDDTSIRGKVTGHALALADEADVDAVVIAGSVAREATTQSGRRVLMLSLTELAGSTDAAMADPVHWVREAAAHAATELG